MTKPEFGEPASFANIAFDAGVIWANKNLIEWLKEKQIMRDSMLGSEWVVIYTEEGPMDLKREDLLRAAKQNET